MVSQVSVIWSIMRGHRLRYGFALLCLILATVFNFGIPLIGSATIDYAIAGKTVAADTPVLLAMILRLLGGADHLRDQLWLAPLAMVLLAGSTLLTLGRGLGTSAMLAGSQRGASR